MTERGINVIVANIWMVGGLLHPEKGWSYALVSAAMMLLLFNLVLIFKGKP